VSFGVAKVVAQAVVCCVDVRDRLPRAIVNAPAASRGVLYLPVGTMGAGASAFCDLESRPGTPSLSVAFSGRCRAAFVASAGSALLLFEVSLFLSCAASATRQAHEGS
jgi:hypothetical protein